MADEFVIPTPTVQAPAERIELALHLIDDILPPRYPHGARFVMMRGLEIVKTGIAPLGTMLALVAPEQAQPIRGAMAKGAALPFMLLEDVIPPLYPEPEEKTQPVATLGLGHPGDLGFIVSIPVYLGSLIYLLTPDQSVIFRTEIRKMQDQFQEAQRHQAKVREGQGRARRHLG